MPATEADEAQALIGRLAEAVSVHIDLERLLAVCGTAGAAPPAPAGEQRAIDLRIGIARDRAFGFYYPEDLESMRRAGAELVFFDTLADAHLPAVDALFIGGGFPEVLAAELAANQSLRAEIRAAVEGGLPTYAECGGLMYLARSIRWHNVSYPMAGALPADVEMQARPVGRGYVHLAPTAAHPWPGEAPSLLRAHEFHYSKLVNADPALRYAYKVKRGHGVDGERDGIVFGNTLASYAHLRSVAGHDWPERFVAFVRSCRAGKTTRAAQAA